VVVQWLAQQEKRAAEHPGAEHGEKIVGGKWEREERWGVAVQVVRQKAVIVVVTLMSTSAVPCR
jgi:hypothetical protein